MPTVFADIFTRVSNDETGLFEKQLMPSKINYENT